MELFRSETMQLVQMIVPAEAAHDTVTALGEVGLVQFRDLNPDRSAFQRTYANQVKRCDEMLRKMRFFAEQMHKAGLVAVPRADAEDRPYHLDELEARLEELEHELNVLRAVAGVTSAVAYPKGRDAATLQMLYRRQRRRMG